MKNINFQQVMKDNFALVDRLVNKVYRTTGAHITHGDLRQAALIGLFEAARNYDEKSNVPFGAYAQHRIRGSMWDYVREHHTRTQTRAGASFVEYEEKNHAENVGNTSNTEYDPEYMQYITELRFIMNEVIRDMNRVCSIRDMDMFVSTMMYGTRMQDAGAAYNVSESRASQIVATIKTQFIERVKAKMIQRGW